MKNKYVNTALESKGQDVPHKSEDFAPEKVPTIVKMAAEIKTISKEAIVSTVNENCSIVDREEMKVVGIKTVFTPESTIGFLAVAEKYANDGTVEILKKALGKRCLGRYVGVSTDIAGGGAFTYIVGLEVDSFDNLPEGLPENTVTCICPGGRFAKIKNTEKDGGYNLWEYFTQGFRKETEYVYDKQLLPYQVLDQDGNVLYSYEPIKIPGNEDEKYDTIDCKIVTLPEIKFAGIKSVAKHGVDVIFKFFSEYEEAVNSLPSRQLYLQDYIGFPLFEGGVMHSCFGAQVSNFDNLPDGIDTLTLKGGLYVHISQLEINNDNPAALYETVDKAFFEKNPQYKRDSNNCDIIRFHQGHSASIYIPVEKKA